MKRRLDPFDRRPMALSVALHGLLFLLAWASTLYEPQQMEFITYEIELVSPPPARQAEEPEPATEELVVERPEPDPMPPEPEVEDIVSVEDTEPEPEPPAEREEPTEDTPPDVADEVMVAAEVDEPEEESEQTGEGLNVRIEGLKRDYPEYYNNIIRQIERCFRWTQGGGWETTVLFHIDRDGNADDIDFVARSGSNAFDFQAMGAVDCAGRGRFGPLPEELPFDRFPVRFTFTLIGDPIVFFPATGKPTEVTFER